MDADVAAVRELALRAYPETVPELVGGESVAAILSSLEPAAAAYQRIVAGLAPTASSAVAVQRRMCRPEALPPWWSIPSGCPRWRRSGAGSPRGR